MMQDTVSEIADEAGIQSELVQELKWIFKNRNWLNVGLCLQPVRHNYKWICCGLS
jgi:hypothetical protein